MDEEVSRANITIRDRDGEQHLTGRVLQVVLFVWACVGTTLLILWIINPESLEILEKRFNFRKGLLSFPEEYPITYIVTQVVGPWALFSFFVHLWLKSEGFREDYTVDEQGITKACPSSHRKGLWKDLKKVSSDVKQLFFFNGVAIHLTGTKIKKMLPEIAELSGEDSLFTKALARADDNLLIRELRDIADMEKKIPVWRVYLYGQLPPIAFLAVYLLLSSDETMPKGIPSLFLWAALILSLLTFVLIIAIRRVYLKIKTESESGVQERE